MRYVYSVSPNKVVCISHFAGKAVRGIAKCDPECDEFVVEKGKELSQARCDLKVAEKRAKRAAMRLEQACMSFALANDEVERMKNYYTDAVSQLHQAQEQLVSVEEKLYVLSKEPLI